jgi:hypothetical protein
MKEYEFKIPIESSDYSETSKYVISQITKIMEATMETGENKIVIRTNLKRGLPLENINKVAGPFIEAWALEKFEDIANTPNNQFDLIHVQAGRRLDPFDVILQFRRQNPSTSFASANVDVKATAQDIKTSGRSPNITSYARIRSAYIEEPDYIFIILSLKHRVYEERVPENGITNGIMEIVSFAVYDLKYLSASDISYNPALGTGQIQVRDIHYVTLQQRTVWEFLQLLDRKFINSRGEKAWLDMARQHEWVKVDEQ